jgi:hypothetical protein
MKLLLIILGAAAFILLPVLAFGQTAGQSSLPKKNVGNGSTLEHFTIANGQLVGRTSAGVLSGLTIGSGLSLSGTTLTAPAPTVAIGDVTGLQAALDGKAATSHTQAISTITGLQTALDGKADTSHTQAISTITGLQTALDAKLSSSTAASTYASLTGSYANPSWITSLAFSKLTGLPSTLVGHGITEFQTDAFILTNVTNSLTAEQRGLGRVSGRDTMQAGGGTLQWYESGAEKIMAWSGRLQASQIDLSAVSIFAAPPASSTAPGEAGQLAYDANFLYICVALNSWRRVALNAW